MFFFRENGNPNRLTTHLTVANGSTLKLTTQITLLMTICTCMRTLELLVLICGRCVNCFHVPFYQWSVVHVLRFDVSCVVTVITDIHCKLHSTKCVGCSILIHQSGEHLIDCQVSLWDNSMALYIIKRSNNYTYRNKCYDRGLLLLFKFFIAFILSAVESIWLSAN